MTDITIHLADGTTISVPITEGAKWERELMKTDKITLTWNAGEYTCIPMGSWITNPYTQSKYTLTEPYFPQNNNKVYKYSVEFKHELMMLEKCPFMFYTYNEQGKVTSVEHDWNFTGKGSDLMLSVRNAIKEAIGVQYTIDVEDDIEASLSLSFTNVSILTALNNIASAWKCEWWTEEFLNGAQSSRKIYFGTKCVNSSLSAYELEAGRNVDIPSNTKQGVFYNRFYVFGSTRNIPQDYQGAQANHIVNKRLTLRPKTQGLASSVHYFENGYIDLPVFDEQGNATYDTETHKYVTNLTDSEQRFTKVIQFDDIYPKSNCRIKYGTIKKALRYVTDANSGEPIVLSDGTYDSFYVYTFHLEFKDNDGSWKDFSTIFNKETYDKESNPSGCLIKGLTLSLHFSSGSLEGREFECTYYDSDDIVKGSEAKYNINVDKGTFEVVHKEDNTIIIPNTGIEPKYGNNGQHNGDEVIVFNCRMPESYYNVAYDELEQKAIEQIYEESKDSNEYSVKSNQVVFAQESPNLSLGRLIKFKTTGRTIDTRITKMSIHLDRSFDCEISMSKGLSKGTINTLTTNIKETEQKVVDVSIEDNTQRKVTKQQFYNALKEQQEAIFDPDGEFQKEVLPLSVKTMMLSVGATSTNFQLQGITFHPNAIVDGESDASRFDISSNNGKLVHFGLAEDEEPLEWSMSGGSVVWMENGVVVNTPDDSKLYYLYAQCNITSMGGSFVLDTKQRMYNSAEGYYYFLVGTLSSATTQNGYKSRILGVTYGNTTINGATITTGKIQSIDGKTYFDVEKGEIGGQIKLSASDDAKEMLEDIATANTIAGEAKTQAAKYSVLENAINMNTTITGGIIQSGVIALGEQSGDEYEIHSGTNGVMSSTAKGGGIASWWGGDMIDGYANGEQDASGNKTFIDGAAAGVIRFDGTGYFANGNLWWDADGKLHADPLSFFVGTESVGALLLAFQLIYDVSASGKITLKKMIPNVPMQSLKVTNASGQVVELKVENGNLFIEGNIVASGDVVAYGLSSTDVPTIKGYVEELIVANPTEAYTAVLNKLKIGDTTYQIEGGGGGEGGMTWGGFGTSTGNAVSNLTYDTSTNTLSGTKATFLTQHQDISGKLDKSAWNVGRTTSTQTDWDNITANGNYFVMNSATEHKPSADWYGQLLVLRGDTNDTITQLYFPYNGGNAWVRSGNPLKSSGGSWNAWKAIAYTTDISSAISTEATNRDTAISSAINALDVASVGGSGKFIESVSETDGKVSATAKTLDKSAVGLSNVDNTSDENKPISTATQTALNGKADIYKNAIIGASKNQGNNNTTLWYRAGYVVFSSTETWKVRNVTLSISDGVMVDKPNLIFLHARKGSSSIQHIGLYSTNPSNTCAKSYTSDDGKIYVELWCSYYGTSTDYRAPYIVILQNSSDNGTNVNSGVFTITLDSRGSKPAASDDVTITDSNTWVHLVNCAQKLQNARSLWGNSFDGSANISGSILHGLTDWSMARNISDKWSGDGVDHAWYGYTHHHGHGVYSTTLSDYYGMLFKTASGLLALSSSGNVGIGTDSPSEKLHVVGNEIIETSSTYGLTIHRKNTNSGAWMRFINNNQTIATGVKVWYHGMAADGKYKFAYNAGSDVVCVTIDNSGNIVATGDVTAYSDARLKSEIKPLTYRGSLEPKEYIKDGKKSIGFIAQEVRELYPELVIGEENEDEYLSLNYGAITAVLAAENKELRAEVETLKSELSEIKEMLNKLMEK